MEHLNVIDKKILHELDLDARVPVSIIAKRLKLSRIVVEYRINKLIKQGIIRSFSSMVDPTKFGFSSWKVYVRFQNLKKDSEQKILDYLVKQKNTWWVVKCYGRYDLLFSVFAESFFEFNEILENFNKKFGQYVLEESINNHLESQYFSRGYLHEKTKKLCEPFIRKPIKEKVSKKDIELLILLGRNCRTKIVNLARKLNTTARVISYKIKDLQKRKIVVFNRLNLNVGKLGMDFYKGLIYLKSSDDKLQKEFIFFCEQNPFINEVVKSVGEWQMEIEVEVDGFKHLNEIIEEIKIKFPNLIRRIDTVLLYDERKSEFNFLDYFY